jgi:uncharacterized protein (TIGR02594 family)
MKTARADLGVKEIPGPKNNPRIMELYRLAGFPGVKSEDVSWCAAFVGAHLVINKLKPSGSLLARSYERGWGTKCNEPIYGAVGTFWRGSPQSGMGHTGFIVGANAEEIFLLNGNYQDGVCYAAIPRSRFTGAWWPKEIPVPTKTPPLPTSLAGVKRGGTEA